MNHSSTMAGGKHFGDLPNELLYEIFSYLNAEDLALSTQHVNTCWREISCDKLIWKKTSFSPGLNISYKKLVKCFENMPMLRSFTAGQGIRLCMCTRNMFKYCKCINSMKLHRSLYINRTMLKSITQNYPNVEYLSLPLPSGSEMLEFTQLLGQCNSLITLHFVQKHSTQLQEGTLVPIANGCSSLQHVDLGHSFCTDHDLQYFLERKNKQLLSLAFRCEITVRTFKLLIQSTELQSLQLDVGDVEFPASWLQCLSKLKNLEYLAIKFFTVGQASTLSTLASGKSLSKTVKLDLSYIEGFKGEVLTCVFRSFNCLRCLILAGNNELFDDNFEYISECYYLEYLDISHCHLLTNKAIEHICTGCKRLKHFYMSDCPQMTDKIVEEIIECRHLKILKLDRCHIQGTYFHLIPSNLIYLQELVISFCEIMEYHTNKIQKIMPHLKITLNPRYKGIVIDLDEAPFIFNQLA